MFLGPLWAKQMRACRIIAGCIAFGLLPVSVHAETLDLLIWEDYISPQVLQDFEASTGITVRQTNFDSGEQRNAILADPGSQFDLVIVTQADGKMFGKRGLLQPLGDTQIEALSDYPQRWRSRCGDYGLPYFWGTLGIVYRSDKIPLQPKHWSDLLLPDPALRGHVAMMTDSADAFVPALKQLGHSISTSDEEDLKAAYALMKAQTSSVRTYTYIITSSQNPEYGQDLYMGLAYSGDQHILNGRAKTPGLWKFSTPDDGTQIWLDCLAITTKSNHRQQALAFVNYLARPEVAARNAEDLRMPTTNAAALDLMPADMKQEFTAIASDSLLSRSQFATDINIAGAQVRKRIILSLESFHDPQ